MKVQVGQWIYRQEAQISRDGERLVKHFRRPVDGIDGDEIRLGPIQKATAPEGKEPKVWRAWGGPFGGSTKVTRERLASSGYTTTAPREIGQ